MLKAAIEKIQEMTKPMIREVEGRTFAISADTVNEIRPTLDRPGGLALNSLDALVKLVKTEALKKYKTPIYLTIPNHMNVTCFSQPDDAEGRYERTTYYTAKATDVPGWEERTQLPFEEAMIALRTRFQPTNDTEYALKLLSEITTGAKITFNDNGVATSVVTKKGIDLQTNQAIRPIITLKPYRTFQEVEQPEGQKEGGTEKVPGRLSQKGFSGNAADGPGGAEAFRTVEGREVHLRYFRRFSRRSRRISRSRNHSARGPPLLRSGPRPWHTHKRFRRTLPFRRPSCFDSCRPPWSWKEGRKRSCPGSPGPSAAPLR